MADAGPTWRLSGVRPLGAEEDSDDEAQRKGSGANTNNRRRRRKPLPPIDVLGPSNVLSAPSAYASPTSAIIPHASAFTVPKVRHPYVPVDDNQSVGGSSGAFNLSPVGAASPPPVASFAPLASPTGSMKQRGASPSLTPLAVASASSRTVTICCCIQIQFEGGTRRCSRTVIWLIIITALICVFSVVTVLLSYYSVDLFQPRTRGGRSMLNKLTMSSSPISSDSSSLDADSWLTSVSVPSDAASRVDPEAELGLFQKGIPNLQAVQTFLTASSQWAEENLKKSPPRVFQPYATDFMSARGLFPDAKAFILLNVWPSGSLRTPCDEMCRSKAADFAAQALTDLEKEGFITRNTLKAAQDGPLGVIPALLASIRAAGAQAVHAEERTWPEAGLSCIKLHAQQQPDTAQGMHSSRTMTMTYCGGLNEASETQRATLRQLLRPVQPWSTLMRCTGYTLHPDVLSGVDVTALAHLKALILSISSVIVQDDSGMPFNVLAKHEPDVVVYGDYKGLGDRDLSSLSNVPDAVVRSLYQPALATWPVQGPLPFKFGYSKVIGPRNRPPVNAEGSKDISSPATSGNEFVRRQDFKGSHLIIARKKTPA